MTLVLIKKLARNRHSREFVKYGAASAAAFIADWGMLSALYRLAGANAMVAATAGFCLGMAVVYFASIYWIFENRTISSPRSEFLLFAGIGVSGLLINNAVLWTAHALFGLAPDIAKPVAAGFVFLFNYMARKALLFTSRRARS